jgi:hypothetical protein
MHGTGALNSMNVLARRFDHHLEGRHFDVVELLDTVGSESRRWRSGDAF